MNVSMNVLIYECIDVLMCECFNVLMCGFVFYIVSD